MNVISGFNNTGGKKIHTENVIFITGVVIHLLENEINCLIMNHFKNLYSKYRAFIFNNESKFCIVDENYLYIY